MVQVEVTEGILEGETINNPFGGTYHSFKGIPFAEPPVGDLRFKAPQPLKPWSGVRSAKEHGPICYQKHMIIRDSKPEGSEDCLYLNVYTPDIEPLPLLPVMFYIHGGGFSCGSGNDDRYGPELLVKENVILVTFNYRVDILGFLCLDTEEIPGNAGMKDQVAALRWVKKNISNFGGDPDNITIFGESAGAGSVAYHLISPMSKGLFKRAIAQSGSATCYWAKSFEPRERAIALARKLGFESQDIDAIAFFFKSAPKENLVQLRVPITMSEKEKEISDVQLTIVDEKAFGDNERFFYGDVNDALRKGIHEGVEVITGYCEHEGLMGLCGVDMKKLFEHANCYNEFFAPKDIVINCPIREVLDAGRKMKKFYFGKNKVSMENLEQLVKFIGMNMFNYQIVQFAKMICNKNKTYFYKFTCTSELNLMSHVFGVGNILGKKPVVCHADDLPYIFNMKILPIKVDQNSETYKLINNVVKLWTNFAKFGNPTPDDSLGVHWSPYSTSEEQYLDIGNELIFSSSPDEEQVEFWQMLFKEYCPHYFFYK
ncbi:carboxylesterase 1F-like [Hyposmocoma kahamanoa]|uniref:carboxylesterase 1F-like n=1 Tax=Hyposmocoma kahamanoa TaxID=1477025 RepID=UPI000E6D8CB2|nr:carboxylesterase 1F-like [Hyposmocoma kahamanoa]